MSTNFIGFPHPANHRLLLSWIIIFDDKVEDAERTEAILGLQRHLSEPLKEHAKKLSKEERVSIIISVSVNPDRPLVTRLQAYGIFGPATEGSITTPKPVPPVPPHHPPYRIADEITLELIY